MTLNFISGNIIYSFGTTELIGFHILVLRTKILMIFVSKHDWIIDNISVSS